MINFLRNLVRPLRNQLAHIKGYREFVRNSSAQAGHFYSPIVSIRELKSREDEIWKLPSELAGIDLRANDQIELVKRFNEFYERIPFDSERKGELRYFFENDYYSYTDGIILYSMIRHLQPKRIVEVGSGFSSAVMLDTNELFFKNQIQLTFIDPYPERLLSLIKPSDKSSCTIVEQRVQDVPLTHFDSLKSGDILFIDSSHVVKTGSDVNFILFEILPRLQPGVVIHVHDIFYPFEYPKQWVFGGRNWNEDYALRAFLMYNNTFEIKLFADYLHKCHSSVFKDMPLAYKNSGGNLWITKK